MLRIIFRLLALSVVAVLVLGAKYVRSATHAPRCPGTFELPSFAPCGGTCKMARQNWGLRNAHMQATLYSHLVSPPVA